jgi:hypothetical protein
VTAKSSIRKWGVLYKSGVYALKVTCLPVGRQVLPWEISHVPWDVACDGNWLRGEQSTLIAWEKSAEGIVGIEQGRLVRHSRAERRRNRYAEP